MIKVFIIMASLVGLLFYFVGGPDGAENQTAGEATATGLQKLAPLPSSISESSGIEFLADKEQYITHNDAGNKADLYQIDATGKLVETYKLNVPNVDWEDLTRDDKGNLYIADTGNNDNKRKELAIYKVGVDNMNQASAIRFTYEDQTEFPPEKKDRNFDGEAIFWHGGQLYIVTKDRGQKQTANIYTVPDKPGNYKAKLVGSVSLNGMVTSAAISPNGKVVALLEEEKLHLFKGFKEVSRFYESDSEEVGLQGTGQTEAVAFEDESTLIISSEGGNLYRYKL